MWPAVTELTDEDGNPTGETVDNLEQLIAALPEGTSYTLVAEEAAEAWWAAHQPPKSPADRRAEIMAELDKLDQKGARSVQAIALAVALGETPDAGDVEAAEKISDSKAALRDELATLAAE
jgi:hypothetical protein